MDGEIMDTSSRGRPSWASAVGIVQGHMCQLRMASHVEHRGGEVGLVKKPTGFINSSQIILDQLDKKCPGGMITYH